MKKHGTVSVLFVCLGNICRSPTAHGIFAAAVQNAGLNDCVRVDSAGTGAWHVGNPPDPRSQAAALERGVDLSSQRARQVKRADFDQFDYILAMDKDNLSDLRSLAPAHYDGVLELFLRLDEGTREVEVPDPYYGGADGFQLVVDLIESASQELLSRIQRQLEANQ
ncbi:low molecular weight phosphotyrosine protein phosphatase [Pseudomaricurvus alkylphenolicus]|uniref:low molecular weight protein-tyrosine-phosphatase n=1 Tax=Pseudomaricurvus alkylphenolicus TaxID=1306991 RepID=UPI00141E1175|nr:low molecular weight protein-tyrosine-phosphatase [Pseudomaricurvus alkylphenolicus]NIB41246.1 low molecular weight phosphotyrosine protein phosphatase [Pseudomaricurvus alkylphenolicus]